MNTRDMPEDALPTVGIIIDPEPDERGQLMVYAVTHEGTIALTGNTN